MTRRRFVQDAGAVAAALALPRFPVNANKPPSRDIDDTAYVQWHVDRQMDLLPDRYVLRGTVDCRGRTHWRILNSAFVVDGNHTAFVLDHSVGPWVLAYNTIHARSPAAFPDINPSIWNLTAKGAGE